MVWTRASFVAAALALTACSGSRGGGGDAGALDGGAPPGEPVLVDDRNQSGSLATCDAGETTAIGLDQVTALGFSASDVLAYAGGTVRAPLAWSEDPALELEPALADEELTVQLEPRADRALFHDPDVDVIGAGAECRPWIELDVDVIVQSSSGALNERFRATLFSKDVRAAFLAATADQPQLQGSLRATRAGQPPGRIDLSLAFSPLGMTGGLYAAWPGAGDAGVQLAHWGQRPCGAKQLAVGPDQAFEGVTPASLIEQVAGSVGIEWLDGSRTTATLGFEAEHGGAACAEVYDHVNGEGAGFQLEGTLTLESADGRLLLSASAKLGASIAEAFEGFAIDAWTNPADTTGALLGFPELDGTGFQPLYRELLLTFDREGVPGGVIGLNGVRKSNCVGSGPSVICEERTEQLERGTVGP